jgi:hypothetical protein
VKKALLIIGALMMVVSGVAAVSAYEAHILNIKAHVENALIVPLEKDLGIVFPEEIVETNIQFGLSESFRAQERVSDVDYALFWYRKPVPDGVAVCQPEEIAGMMYYQDLAPYLTLQPPSEPIDGLGPGGYAGPVGAPPAIGHGNLSTPSDLIDTWHLVFDVPVFREWYNPTTDPNPDPNILEPDQYCVVNETVTENGYTVEGLVPHADLGADLKIQVFGYSYHIP